MRETTIALGRFIDALADGVLLVGSDGKIALANAAVKHLLGYAPEELEGRPLEVLVPEQFRARHHSLFASFQSETTPRMLGRRPILHAVDKSGHEIPVSISLANIDIDGARYSIAVIRDAARFDEHLSRALERAETDPLTRLGNRTHLEHKLRELLAHRDAPIAVLYLDLADFKRFNDRYGHQVGDAVLQTVAKRLKAVVRTGDVAARVGGDEFVVVLRGVTDRSLIESRAFAIREAITRHFDIGGVTGHIDVDIGCALRRPGKSDPADLLRRADMAMYDAKRMSQPLAFAD